jgi:hypothetical protein
VDEIGQINAFVHMSMENQFNRNTIKCESDRVMLYRAFRVLLNLFVVFDLIGIYFLNHCIHNIQLGLNTSSNNLRGSHLVFDSELNVK